MRRLFFLLIILLFKNGFLVAQIKWSLIDDTTTLSPNIISCTGDVTIQQGKSETSLQVSGIIEIILNAKTVILHNSKDIYNFKDKDLVDLSLNGYGRFQHEDIFKDYFTDSLYKYYRKALYPTLDLNEISLSISKRAQYSLEDTGLILKNQKLILGKLCYSDLDNFIMIDENGEIHNVKDGDFNFFVFNGVKNFTCKDLYSYIFINYLEKLKGSIVEWKERVKKESIEELIETFGAIDKIISISNDKKMVSWNENIDAYNIFLSTYGTRLTLANTRSYTQSSSLFTNISPLFLFGNNGITSASNTDIRSATSTFQSGTVTSKDIGFSLTIIQDANNNTTQVYQHNIFLAPEYGMAFRFINL